MGSDDDNGDVNLNCQRVTTMEMNSGSMFKSSNASDHLFGSGWDPLVSLGQAQNFGGVSPSMVNHTITSEFASNNGYAVDLESQGLLHYQTDHSSLSEMMPKLPCFESGSFSNMVNPFGGMSQCGQITHSLEDGGVVADGGASPDQMLKRRASHSSFKPIKNAEGGPQKEISGDSSSENGEEKEDKKQKIEHIVNSNSRGKQTGKQAKENSDSGGAPNENYIHIRAKRGQATNSHSLAERVRRERISERMRLLQELVPGCNKITGKAVMLDEIINYVQSLQQQVEFLSMKLATVNPELNIDIDRILSKDILQSRGNNLNPALLGFNPGLTSSHPYSQGGLPGIPGPTPPFHHMHPQPVWDHDLQNLLQMGFDTNTAINNLGPNGRSKLEL